MLSLIMQDYTFSDSTRLETYFAQFCCLSCTYRQHFKDFLHGDCVGMQDHKGLVIYMNNVVLFCYMYIN